MAKLLAWLKKKNRQRLERRHATRRVRIPNICSHIDFTESVPPGSLRLRASPKPVVSVIIPGYGKADYTLRCLKSLQDASQAIELEVLVVEDASGDASADWLKQVDGIQLIWNEVNLGFLRSCNKAAALSRGEFIYLLNNDTVLMPGALEALLATAMARPDAGIVGSKLIYPDGTLQEAGGVVWSNGDAANYGRHKDPFNPLYCYAREADYISGASILLRRDLWVSFGGFDERYAPAYYEDTDLSIRLQKAGHPTIYEPRSVVVHCEGVSNGTSTDHGVKAYQVVNRDKFIQAHTDYLRSLKGQSGDLSYRSIDRLQHRAGLVLIIDHHLPEPDMDAGSRNMIEFIRTLQYLGYVVKFWPQSLRGVPKYVDILERMGVETFRGPYQTAFSDWVSRSGKDITHVILSRPTVAPHYFDEVRSFTNAKVIYYGHDLHFARMQMESNVKHDASIAAAAENMRRVEMEIWQRADLVLYPSQEEVQQVLKLAPATRAAFVQPFQFETFVGHAHAPRNSKLLFVAGFQHSPNVDAATWLVNDVMPLIWAQAPDVQLYLVGSKPTDEVKSLACPGRVMVTGAVSVEELEEHYATARVAVVPLRFGAGVKLKVLEAMQQGLPLVTTAIGLQGLPDVPTELGPRDQPDAMAARILALVSDDAAWLELSAMQSRYVQTHFSLECMRNRFRELFGHDLRGDLVA